MANTPIDSLPNNELIATITGDLRINAASGFVRFNSNSITGISTVSAENVNASTKVTTPSVTSGASVTPLLLGGGSEIIQIAQSSALRFDAGGGFTHTFTGLGGGIQLDGGYSDPTGGWLSARILRASIIDTTGGAGMSIQPDGDLTLNPSSANILFGNRILHFGNAAALAQTDSPNQITVYNPADPFNFNFWVQGNLYTNDIKTFGDNLNISPFTGITTLDGALYLNGGTSGFVSISSPASPTSYGLVLPTAQGGANTFLRNDGSGNLSWAANAGGDVTGPASSTDNALVMYDGTTGKLIKNSPYYFNGSYIDWNNTDFSNLNEVTAFQFVATSAVLSDEFIATSYVMAPNFTSQNDDINFNDKDFTNVGTINSSQVNIVQPNNMTVAFSMKDDSYANNSFQTNVDGMFEWGDGTSTFDTILRRTAAGTVRISDTGGTLGGTLEVSDIYSTATGPLGLFGGTDLVLASDSGTVTTAVGQVLRLKYNNAPAQYVTFTPSSGSNLAILASTVSVNNGGNGSLSLGNTTTTSTATPLTLMLGNTLSNTAGANPKLIIWGNTPANYYGFGVSSSQFDYIAPSGASHAWYQAGTKTMWLDTSNILNLLTGLKLPTSWGTASTLDGYEHGTLTRTWSGIWGSAQNGDIYYSRTGKTVLLTITLGTATATTAATISISSVLPSYLRPTNDYLKLINVVNNGSNVNGLLGVSAGGNVTISLQNGPFTNSGTAGLGGNITAEYELQ